MNAGIKLAMVFVAGAILVAGCGQSNSGSAGTSPSQPAAAAQPQPAQSPPQKFSVDSVDGYKSFKFGMKPSELTKLAECTSNGYDAKLAAETARLETELVSLETELVSLESELVGLESELVDLNDVNSKICHRNIGYGNEKCITDKKVEISEKKGVVGEKKGVIGEKRRVIGAWKSNDLPSDKKESILLEHLHCKLNFGGNDYQVHMDKSSIPAGWMGAAMSLIRKGAVLYFNDHEQLGGVQIPLGNFNQEKLNSLIQELQVKYPLSSTPSDAAIATANREPAVVSWFFANNGVELRLISDGQTKLMALYYHDAISAKEAFKQSQKGKVTSGDL